MMTTAIFVTPGRDPKGNPSCDFQATAVYDGGRDAVSSYSGMSREDAIRWLDVDTWGQLGYRPERDTRFTIGEEWLAFPGGGPRLVVRFCGNWIGLYAETLIEAERLRDDYAVARRWKTILPELTPIDIEGEPL